MHKIRGFSWVLAVLLFISCICMQVSAVQGSDLCYQYTPQMTDNTFRYLDEIYISKYPAMGLRFRSGTDADRQRLQKLSDQITQGCTTDLQKAQAIAAWMKRNVRYVESSSNFYAMDVFYGREGNCAGYAILMEALLRLEGIPAVWGDGFRMETQKVTVERMQNTFAGHAWCFAYIGGQWMLFDPLWEGEKGLTDRAYIAKNYFLDTVDQITPAYDSSNMPPARNPESVFAYVDGRFMSYRNGQVNTTIGATTVLVNASGNYLFVAKMSNDKHVFPDDPNRQSNMIVGELFSGGWYKSGTLSMDYAYENGVTAFGVVMERDGVRYYMSDVGSLQLYVPEGAYYLRDGDLCVDPSYSGRIVTPYWYAGYSNDPNYEITWQSMDPQIATVDQNGVITGTGAEGAATFHVELKSKASYFITVFFQKETRVADYSDHNIHTCSYQPQVVAPTCTTGGYTLYSCSCGKSYKDGHTSALGHSYGQWQVVEAPTENRDGMRQRTCIRCPDAQLETIPKLEHVCSYEETIVLPGCVTEGYTQYTCRCGKQYREGTVAPLGHLFGQWEISMPPTETTVGHRFRTCSRCGEQEYGEIPAGSDVSDFHTCSFFQVREEQPTCTSPGYIGYQCGCGQSYQEPFGEPLGHDYGPWITETEPTQTTPGMRYRSCSRCSQRERDSIPPLGGGTTPHVCEYQFQVGQEATCTEAGYMIYVCSCGNTRQGQAIAPLGHSFWPWEVIEVPTETTDGQRIRQCSRCPEFELQTIPAGTDMSQFHECQFVGHCYEPSCTQDGYTVYTCNCGNTYTADIIPAPGHSYTPWEVVDEPTEFNDGLRFRGCIACGEIEEQILPATGGGSGGNPGAQTHQCSYSVLVVMPPSCQEEGFTVYGCSCGKERVGDYTEPTGHSYGSWIILAEPTATQAGARRRECVQCGYAQEQVMPPLGSSEPLPEDPQDQIHHCTYTACEVIAPTCQEDGFTVYACQCGKMRQDDYVDPIPHQFEGWQIVEVPTQDREGLQIRICIACGEEQQQKLPSTGSSAEQPEDTSFSEKLQEQAFGISIGYTSEQKQYYSQLQLQVSELRDEAADSAVQLIAKTAGEVRRSRVFDISLLNTEGVSVQPDGTILVTIPVPQNWAGEDLHVFYVDPKAGTTEDMGATLSQDGTHVRFTTDHFSYYTLVQLTPKNELPILWGVFAGVAAVLLIAAGVLIFVKKKKAA